MTISRFTVLFVLLAAGQPQVDHHHHDEHRQFGHALQGLAQGAADNVGHQEDHHGHHEPAAKPREHLVYLVKQGPHSLSFR